MIKSLVIHRWPTQNGADRLTLHQCDKRCFICMTTEDTKLDKLSWPFLLNKKHIFWNAWEGGTNTLSVLKFVPPIGSFWSWELPFLKNYYFSIGRHFGKNWLFMWFALPLNIIFLKSSPVQLVATTFLRA